MAFKFWGKSNILSLDDLKNELIRMGLQHDSISKIVNFLLTHGGVKIGRTKILVLKYK